MIISHSYFILQCVKNSQSHTHFASNRKYLVQKFVRPFWKTFQEKLIKSIVFFKEGKNILVQDIFDRAKPP